MTQRHWSIKRYDVIFVYDFHDPLVTAVIYCCRPYLSRVRYYEGAIVVANTMEFGNTCGIIWCCILLVTDIYANHIYY